MLVLCWLRSKLRDFILFFISWLVVSSGRMLRWNLIFLPKAATVSASRVGALEHGKEDQSAKSPSNPLKVHQITTLVHKYCLSKCRYCPRWVRCSLRHDHILAMRGTRGGRLLRPARDIPFALFACGRHIRLSHVLTYLTFVLWSLY